jgi:hypothetical protein
LLLDLTEVCRQMNARWCTAWYAWAVMRVVEG